MRKHIVIMLGIFSFLFGCNKVKNENYFQDNKFKVGQIWNYKTRLGEEDSKITILKIEKYYDKEIVIHIYIDGLKIRNELSTTGISDNIGHMPISKESLSQSVTNLVSSNNKLPNFREGYENWKEAFDSHKGGIFTTNVSEAVKFVEEAMKNGEKTKS